MNLPSNSRPQSHTFPLVTILILPSIGMQIARNRLSGGAPRRAIAIQVQQTARVWPITRWCSTSAECMALMENRLTVIVLILQVHIMQLKAARTRISFDASAATSSRWRLMLAVDVWSFYMTWAASVRYFLLLLLYTFMMPVCRPHEINDFA